MNYVFERISGGEFKFQVRLQGIFVCYTDVKSSRMVDSMLFAEGYESREAFVKQHTEILAAYFQSAKGEKE